MLSILGGLFVSAAADRMFHYSIFSQLYQVDTLRCQKDHGLENNNTNQAHTERDIHQDEELKYTNLVQYSSPEHQNTGSNNLIDTHQRDKFRKSYITKARENMK